MAEMLSCVITFKKETRVIPVDITLYEVVQSDVRLTKYITKSCFEETKE